MKWKKSNILNFCIQSKKQISFKSYYKKLHLKKQIPFKSYYKYHLYLSKF